MALAARGYAIIKEGYLIKKSKYFNYPRKRWIVLQDSKLYSYKNEQKSGKPTEIIELTSSHSIENDQTSLAMYITSLNKVRTFSAFSIEDLNIWTSKIEAIINPSQSIAIGSLHDISQITENNNSTTGKKDEININILKVPEIIADAKSPQNNVAPVKITQLEIEIKGSQHVLHLHQIIYCEDGDFRWSKARIIDITFENTIKINYIGLSSKYDEIINLIEEKHRISITLPNPIQKVQFLHGTWARIRQRLLFKNVMWCKEVKITEIIDESTVILTFLNGNKRMSQLQRSQLRSLNEFIAFALKSEYKITEYIPFAVISVIERFLSYNWFQTIECGDASFQMDQWVDYRQNNGRWRQARIIAILNEYNQVTIRCDDQLWEAVQLSEIELLHSKIPICLKNGVKLMRNKRVDFNDENGCWYAAQIINIPKFDINQTLTVKYMKDYKCSYATVDLFSSQERFQHLHSLSPITLINGSEIRLHQRVLCQNGDGWYEGEISKIYDDHSVIKICYSDSESTDVINLGRKSQQKRIRTLQFVIDVFVKVCCKELIVSGMSQLIESYIELSVLNVICKNEMEFRCGKWIMCRGKDNKWYKAQVLSVQSKNKIKVHIIELGSIEILDLNWQLFKVRALACQ